MDDSSYCLGQKKAAVRLPPFINDRRNPYDESTSPVSNNQVKLFFNVNLLDT
jgi:hypothetical protein